MSNKPNVNRKHKDSLFRRIFDDKEALLSLYNAVNDSDYSDPEAITINTIEDVLYMGVKNDHSFLIANYLELFEAQSTWNPNMPLRGVFYFASLYKGYVAQNELDIYGESRIQLPTPQYIVFYNGMRKIGERMELRLSESFSCEENEEPALECVVTYLNVNYGHNQEIMSRCRKLYEYSYLIDRIRAGVCAGKTTEEAVDEAVQQCIEEGVLADFLRKHRAEVSEMVMPERAEEIHIKNLERISREKGMEEGRAVGRAEGRAEGIAEGRAEGIAEGRAEGIAEGRKEGIAEAIRAMLELCREMDMPETTILKKISERFQMDENQVAEFL